MIISVPHSGTRSLRDHLGEDGYWHWGQNDADINLYEGHADVPIRDPFDITISWISRYPTEDGKGQDEIHRRLDLMIDWVRHRPDTFLHKVEDLPLRVGEGPKHWARDKKRRGKALGLDRVISLRKWVRDRMSFYEPFYGEFWWLTR